MFKPQHKVKIRWSPNFSYAIGLITSDGNLMRNGRHISIKSLDKEMVENFREALGIKNRIGKGSRSNEKIKKYFYVYCGDVIFYRFLNKIGIKAAKSKTIKLVKIPNKFFPDFLRGLFDGDGSFYTFQDKRWPNSFGYQISFPSASLKFIQWLKKRLNNLYGVKGFIRKGDGVFVIRYVKGDTRKIFSVMYYKNNILFLKRKYEKIKKILDKENKLNYNILNKLPR